MNKLDYLAQKEEELRRLNEQLEQRKRNILSEEHESEVRSSKVIGGKA
jgi:hypothetical protein